MKRLEGDSEIISVVIVILSLIFTHYIFPIIHYCCMGACLKRRHVEQYEANISSIDTDNQYAVSDEESKTIFKTEKSYTRVFAMHCTFWSYTWIIFLAAVSGMEDEPTYVFVLKVFGYIHLSIFILFLWVEMFFSWEYKYLKHKLEEKTCKAYIQDLIETQPEAMFQSRHITMKHEQGR